MRLSTGQSSVSSGWPNSTNFTLVASIFNTPSQRMFARHKVILSWPNNSTDGQKLLKRNILIVCCYLLALRQP